MNDPEKIFLMFMCISCLTLGAMGALYFQIFETPTMKIWESPRDYDHILIIDDVVCTPMSEINSTYYHIETFVYNKTEYIVRKSEVENTTVKGIVVCQGGKP